MVLGGQLPGRVDGRQNPVKNRIANAVLFFCPKEKLHNKKDEALKLHPLFYL